MKNFHPMFPIVGIGASAGGLAAFTQLLEELPLDTGMAFVLVQHLDPTHESALTDLLAKATEMRVREVTANLKVEANQVYVIPPNYDLTLEQDCLRLKPRQKSARARSIDIFFQSLAVERKDGAIAIILSGAASDGTAGAEAVKAEGGIVFAQDDSADFESMPRHVIDAGCADFVLSPKEIARELAQLAKQTYPAKLTSDEHSLKPFAGKQGSEPSQEIPKKDGSVGFPEIIELLHERVGIDFSSYKPSTLERRIVRRIMINKLEDLGEYFNFLQKDAEEIGRLYKDILIGVTNFFRDPKAFEVLPTKIFPELLRFNRDNTLRIWVPGCSSGQEAFSLAMIYAEFADTVENPPHLKIFATDINEEQLNKGRRGFFTKSLVEDVSADRLERFFMKENGGYRFIKELQGSILFARQNVFGDPPFSRIDLISCRNLLIYFEPKLQKKVMPLFHYALNPHGILFLGSAESIESHENLFEPIDKKNKFFRKKPTVASLPDLQLSSSRKSADSVRSSPALPFQVIGEASALAAQREADRLTINQYAPPSVLIDESFQILQFRGETDRYLRTPTGAASLNLLKMLRPGLMLPMRSALETAMNSKQSVWENAIVWHQADQDIALSLKVIPLKNIKKPYYLIFFLRSESSFIETTKPGKAATIETSPTLDRLSQTEEETRRTIELEAEITEARDYIQSLQEQYDASHSEFQTSNEEVQSANEELQSINEELETSKEELESTNEELKSANDELASRNTELNRANSDLLNFQTNVMNAIVLIGPDLTIRRFSPKAEKIFNLRASDIGHPLNRIKFDFDFPDLKEWVQKITRTASDQSREVQDKNGRWYSLRGRPYITVDNKIDGAVLVLIDIDDLKKTQKEIKAAHDYLNAILSQAPPMLILNTNLRISKVNRSFSHHFEISRDENIDQLIYDLGNGEWNIPSLRDLLAKVLTQPGPLPPFEVTHTFKNIGSRVLVLNATQISDTQTILLAIDDITDQRATENRLKELNHTLEEQVAERMMEIQERIEQLQQLSFDLVNTEQRERRELAVILHDDLQQILVATQMHARVALGPNGTPEQKSVVMNLISEAIESTRELAKELAPPVLYKDGLAAALQWLARWAQKRYSLKVEVETEEEVNPTDAIASTFLFEGIKELILNVVKHAKTDRMQINLSSYEDEKLRLQVRDFGQGFDPKTQNRNKRGMGIFSLKERIGLMNGEMRIESLPGDGTLVEIIMPRKSDRSESSSE